MSLFLSQRAPAASRRIRALAVLSATPVQGQAQVLIATNGAPPGRTLR